MKEGVTLHYVPIPYTDNEPYDNLDMFLQAAEKVREARNAIREKYTPDITCIVHAGSIGDDERYPALHISFREVPPTHSANALEAALEDYFSAAGFPYTISIPHLSDAKRVKNVLEQRGMQLAPAPSPFVSFLLGIKYYLVVKKE